MKSNCMKSIFLSLLTLLSFSTLVFAQEQQDEGKLNRHRFNLAMGHAHIPSAVHGESGKSQVMVPSWGLGYSYKFSERFALGLKSDFEFSNYIIEDENENELERENPVSLLLAFEYKIYKDWGLTIAPGMEFEKEEDLFIMVFATFYEVEFNEHWDFTPELAYEIKGGHTGALIMAFGIGYSF